MRLKKHKRKIKIYQVVKFLIMVLCLTLILHDTYLVIFKSCQWTWLGVISFIIVTYIFIDILDDFVEQIKKMSNACDKRHQNK